MMTYFAERNVRVSQMTIGEWYSLFAQLERGGHKNSASVMEWYSRTETQTRNWLIIDDEDFLKTYELYIKNGRRHAEQNTDTPEGN